MLLTYFFTALSHQGSSRWLAGTYLLPTSSAVVILADSTAILVVTSLVATNLVTIRPMALTEVTKVLVLLMEAVVVEAEPATTVARKGEYLALWWFQLSWISLLTSPRHNKADCPEPRVIRCRHCNEEGHYISQCPDPTCPPQEPREFTGECRSCGQQGHRAADCPDRGPMLCNNCQQEGKFYQFMFTLTYLTICFTVGHAAVACKNARVVNRDDVKDVSAEAAWEMIVEGAKIRDLDDVKEGVQCYVKSTPQLTYQGLETAFRNQNIGVYLIAVEKPSMLGSLTNMDFQGNLDKKYQVTYRFDARAARPREAALWPKDAEENMTRLADAGEPVNRGLTKCNNCDKYGHMVKNCPDEKTEKERVKIICFNCNEEGHRVRDCKLHTISCVHYITDQLQAQLPESTSSPARTAASLATRLPTALSPLIWTTSSAANAARVSPFYVCCWIQANMCCFRWSFLPRLPPGRWRQWRRLPQLWSRRSSFPRLHRGEEDHLPQLRRRGTYLSRVPRAEEHGEGPVP